MPPLNESQPPFETAKNGRRSDGKFQRGNQVARGHRGPHKAAQFRARLFAAVSAKDFGAIVRRLVDDAKTGKQWAVKLLMAYLLGEPRALDALMEVEAMRAELERLRGNEDE